ncbi:MAG TPA: hypothetical protein VK250_06630 [Nitrososphaeraceae archaeon]|nr:hypothetical protein [Nitrososphaeraceae archaeon]
MNSEMSDEEWIERFNEFSRKFYYQRYKAMFKPTSSISSIILPSDRHEIEVGINHLIKEDKEKIKSMEDFSEQVLGLIAILEEPIKHYYDIMQQDFIEKAIKYYSDGVDINKTSDSSNIGIQLVNHISLFCDDKFTFEDATKIIERNQEKYENNIINRLLGSVVPILVKKREDIETKEHIENVVEDFMKHDLDMMVMDVATERQRLGWTK